MGIRLVIDKPILNASGIRILIMGISFSLLFFLKLRILFQVQAVMTILIVYLGLIMYPLYGSNINIGGMLMMLISTVMINAIPYSIYHPIKDKKIIFTINGLTLVSGFIVIGFSRSYLEPEAFASISALVKNELMLGFAFIGAYIAINWILYQYQIDNYHLQKKIAKTNEEINQSIHLIEKQAITLQDKEQDLQERKAKLLAAQSSLEQQVDENTLEVNEKTKLLLKLSYINSHYLRAPISRIKSVLQVWKDLSKVRREEMIDQSLVELKTVIKGIIHMDKQKLDIESFDQYLKSLTKKK